MHLGPIQQKMADLFEKINKHWKFNKYDEIENKFLE